METIRPDGSVRSIPIADFHRRPGVGAQQQMTIREQVGVADPLWTVPAVTDATLQVHQARRLATAVGD